MIPDKVYDYIIDDHKAKILAYITIALVLVVVIFQLGRVYQNHWLLKHQYELHQLIESAK